MDKMMLSLALLAAHIALIHGFASGPPPGICLAPYPHHYENGAAVTHQPNEHSPYTISLSPNQYTDGSLINITITSNTSKSFKGLLITFKRKTSEMVLPVGQFISCDTEGFKFYNIQGNNNSCLVHSNGKIKPMVVRCSYQAPVNNLGPLRMSALLVQDYSTFWSRLEQTVSYSGLAPLQTMDNPTVTLTKNVTEGDCGSSKSCLFFPNSCVGSATCEYMVSYKKSGDFVDLEMIGPGEGYLALAISNDTIMKNDFVIVCVMDPDSKLPHVQTGFTKLVGSSKSMDYTVDNNVMKRKSASILNVNGKIMMACSFSIPGSITYPPPVPYPTDLTQQLYLFLANGPLYPNTSYLKKHVEAPLILISPAVLYTDTVSHNKYFSGLYYPRQIHGTLMTVAFVILLPLAVMIARHFRHHLKVVVGGKQIWFYLHVGCNIMFFIFAFAGYFYIIANVENNWNPAAKVHGAVGTVVMILAVVNIVMGFARPDLGTPTRIYFYWAHFLNGTLIRLLAFVTFWLVFITLTLRSYFKNWMMVVVVVWTVIDIFISIAYGIMRKLKRDHSTKKEYEIDGERVPEAMTNHVGWLGVVVYVLFVVMIAIALLVGLWIN